MKASRFLGLIIVLTLLVTLSQTMVRDSAPGLAAGTAFTVNAYDIVGNESEQSQGVLGVGENAHAQGVAINAASCEQTDVQAAIDSAITGDTVVVPAGNCTWSSDVSIPNDKKITLQGAGMELTVITGSGVDMTQSGSRVTGFGFIDGGIGVDGDGWRVDHCKFHASSFSAGVSVRGTRSSAIHPTGLVDNCSFYNTRVLVIGTAAMLHENDWQHVLWTTSLDLGTNNNVVYVEDCNFEFDVFGNAIDANYGAAYVFRFNYVSGVYIELHSVQGNNRATRRWEIYGNTIDNPGSSIYYPYRIRAGTGVVFNDTLVGTWTNYGIALDNVRSYDARGDGGKCDGNSTWDGNENATGYPCRDQIGRGPDNPQWDHDPVGAYTQPLVPAYAWENRRQSNNALVPFKVINSGEDHIQENRDFYNHNASFDGTSGVGVGALANRPSTCTTGVGYWATDQGEWNSENPGPDGQLYKCTATDTWELYYTPYTYPHPLRGESLVLRGAPADQAIHLTWQVGASLPPTSTWQIAYDGPTGDQPSPISGIISPTRAYTLTGLTNYTWYTVTLNAMLDGTPFLTDTVRVMPTDIFVYLPLVLR